MVDCDGLHSVAILSLDGFGLVGSLPEALGDLTELTVLALANNPHLGGALPASLSALPHMLWLSVEGTGVVACAETGSGGGGDGGGSSSGGLAPSVSGPCTLPAALSFTEQPYNPYGSDALLCPAAVLTSFLAYTSSVPPDLWDVLTSPFPSPPAPGSVIADGNFTRFYGCACSRAGESLTVQEAGVVCARAGGGGSGRLGLIIAVVIVAVVPWLLVGAVVYICVVHKATLNRVVRRKEAEMARKRSKVPGTPGVVLQNGRGLLSLSDVMVTWVVTDVAASTQLWEWKPDVMDRAIDMHNVALRSLIETYGGHEIRNEGDSFTLSFHDAVDAVMFCIKAQEKLMTVDWPKELAEHPRTSTVSVGDVTSNPEAAGKGPPLIAGLRVRMGINTGLPDDIFLHDMTDHVDYRGVEYDLAGEICDLAEGGQVLMGPRTLQRWNKVNYSALIDPLTADLMRDQQGGSFLAGAGQNPLAQGASGRRASVTGFGANVGGGMLSLTRDSQQLAVLYGSTIGMPPPGAPGGGPPHGLTLAPSIRRNSDTHALPHGGSGAPFSRLSDGEGSDDDAGSSARPSAAVPNSAALRPPRVHHTSSPSRLLQRMMPIRDGYSSDGTAAGGGRVVLSSSPLMSMHRSKLGSPRAIQLSSMSCNDNTLRPRPAAGTPASAAPAGQPSGPARGDDAAGPSSGPNLAGAAPARPAVRRVNSMEGLLRQHAARAAENAAAAAAAAAAAQAAARAERERAERERATAGSLGGLAARALALLTGGGGGSGAGNNPDVSDDDRGSSHLPVPGPRLSNARGSTGSIPDAPAGPAGPGLLRRRGEEVDYSGTSPASAPLAGAPGLQRWLSHGWRGRPGPVLPRSHTLAGSAAAAAAAAAVVGSATAPPSALPVAMGSGGAGHSPANGGMAPLGAGRTTGSGVSIGGRLLWSRLNGLGAPPFVVGGLPANLRALGTGMAAHGGGPPVPSNGGSIEGPASLPLVPFEDEMTAGSGASGRALSRVTSLPAAAAGAMASGLTRLAALHRRGGPSREGSLRVHNPLFLRQNSREGSRDGRGTDTSGAATPMRTESQGAHHSQHQLQHSGGGGGSGGVAGSPDGSPGGNGEHRSDGGDGGGGGGGTSGHGNSGGGGGGASGGTVVLGPPGGGGRAEMLLRPTPSRRTLAGVPGPPRILRTSDTGLHPLLLNPMQPGGAAAMHPMLGRLPTLRHSQQPLGRQAGPSPLGMVASSVAGVAGAEAATGPHSVGGHEPLPAAGEVWGDSLTSGAPTRHLTPASTFRQVLQDTVLASVDGLAGSSAAQGGDSTGSKPASNGLQPTASGGRGGSHPQLSYHHTGTQGGYYAADGAADLLGLGAGLGVSGGGVGDDDDRPLVLRLLFGMRALWRRLAAAFRVVVRRCLVCVRLLTSSEDDPTGVDIWEHADSTLAGRGDGGGPMGHHRSVALGSKPQETKGVLVDMGYYRFSAIDAVDQRPMDHFVHLMQVVPASVASRVLLFPWPLSLPDGWEKISPGFFDAPGSGRLLFPPMRELIGSDAQALRPVVTVAFSSVEGFKELSALNVETARQVLAMHNMAVRETLSACSGYECKEFNGNFMSTFAMPTDAVEWALTLQLALLAIRWPPALRSCEQTALVLHPHTNAVLFNGLRCRVGIYAGPIDRVTPHVKTGRADYFGQPVNRAARLMTAALGGQVVLDQNLLDEVLEEWRRRQEVRRLATIPSVDEGSPVDEGSLVTPSEIRTARSFVSVKSATRIVKQPSVVTGTYSAAASSNPSISNLPHLSELALQQQHASPRADAIPAPAAPTAVGPDGMPPSPFGSPGGSLLNRLLPGHAARDYATDSSVSPRGSVHRGGMSPAYSPNTMAAAAAVPAGPAGSAVAAAIGVAGPVSVTAASTGQQGGTGSNAASAVVVTGGGSGSSAVNGLMNTSSANSLARSLERLLLEQRVQRSARSEPRIPRISRFGLGGLTAALRGGAGTPPAPAPTTVPAASSCGGAGSGVVSVIDPIGGSGGLALLPAHVVQAGLPPPLYGTTSVPAQWPSEAIGTSPSSTYMTGAPFTRRSPNGGSRLVPSPRGLQSSGGAGPTLSGGAALAPAPWPQPPNLTRASPNGSMQSSVAGGLSGGGAEPTTYGGRTIAPGLELQPAEWDPAARGAANRARRRRRASIGAIVENMLVAGRKASMTAAQTGFVHGGRGAGGPGRSPPSRISPAAALARMLPGSPHGSAAVASGAGGAAASGGSHASIATAFAAAAGLHIELPDSPSNSSNPVTSPRSPSTLASVMVRRMASSPLGPTPQTGTSLHMMGPSPPAAAAPGSGSDAPAGPGSHSGGGGTGAGTIRAAGSTNSGGGGASNSGVSGSGHLSRSGSRGSGLGLRSGGGAGIVGGGPWSGGNAQTSTAYSPAARPHSLQAHSHHRPLYPYPYQQSFRHAAAQHHHHSGAAQGVPGLPPPPPPPSPPPHNQTLSPARGGGGRHGYQPRLTPAAVVGQLSLPAPPWAVTRSYISRLPSAVSDEGRSSAPSNGTYGTHPLLSSVAENGSPSSVSQQEPGAVPISSPGSVAAVITAVPAAVLRRNAGLSHTTDGEGSGPLLETAISSVAPARAGRGSGSSLLISRGSVAGAPGAGVLPTHVGTAGDGAAGSGGGGPSPELLLGCAAVLEGSTSGSESDREGSSSASERPQSTEVLRRRPMPAGPGSGAGIITLAAAAVSEATAAAAASGQVAALDPVASRRSRSSAALGAAVPVSAPRCGGAGASTSSLPSDPAPRGLSLSPSDRPSPVLRPRSAAAGRWHSSPSRSRSSTGSPAPNSRVYEATASGGVPALGTPESDTSVFPSFTANVLPPNPSSGGGPSRNGRASGSGYGAGGGGGSFSSVRSDVADLLALAGGSGRASLAATPMPGRGFVTLHGNPMYGAPRGGGAGGEEPIAEEEDGWDDASPLGDAEAGTLELIGTTASSRRLIAAAAAAAAAAAPSRSRDQLAFADPLQQLHVDNPVYDSQPRLDVEGSAPDLLLGMPPVTGAVSPVVLEAASTAPQAVLEGADGGTPANGRAGADSAAAPGRRGERGASASGDGDGSVSGAGAGGSGSVMGGLQPPIASAVALRERHGHGSGARGSQHSSGGTIYSGAGFGGDASSPQRHPAGPFSQDAALATPMGLPSAAAARARRSAHGIRPVVLSSPYGAVPPPPQPVDPATLATGVASSGSGQPSRGVQQMLSGTASGGAQYTTYEAMVAGGSAVPRPPAPLGLAAGSSGRRRASYGGLAVSLRAAAEAAISQLQAMNASSANNSVSQGRRVLRKSTSSRGQRHYSAASGGSSADTAAGLAAAAAAFYSSAGAGVGIGAAIATPRPLRTTSGRRARVHASGDAIGGGGLPLGENVNVHHAGGRFDSRLSSPPLDKLLGAPRAPAAAPHAGPSSAGNILPMTAPEVALRGIAHLRRSAPGIPLGAVPLPPPGLAAIAAAAPPPPGNPAYASAPEAPPRGALRASSGVFPAGAHFTLAAAAGTPLIPRPAPLHPQPLALPNADFAGAPPIYSIHGPGASPGPINVSSRRSSAASQAALACGQASPGHASPSPQAVLGATATQLHPSAYHSASSSAAHSRHVAQEALASPLAGAAPAAGPATSAPGLFPRSQRGGFSLAAAVAGGVPGLSSGAVSAGNQGLRGMLRTSTPQLLGLAVAPGGADVAAAAAAAAGAASGGSGLMVAVGGRLRSSHQSLPDEVLVAAQAAMRELSPQGQGPSGAPQSTRGGNGAGGGSRWRSPRAPSHADDGGSGTPGGASGSGPADKQSHSAEPIGGGGGGGSAAGIGPRTESGAPRGLDKDRDKEKDKENRPAVMAECYKITQQPAGGMGGGGNEVAQSITMIKYTNLKQELERAEEGEGDDVPVPTNMLLVPTVAVEVAIWSLGSFRLKGVTEPIKIVQVLPSSLEGRLSVLNKAGLNRGKARCIERKVSCIEMVQLQLPDVSRLACVMAAAGTPGDGGSDDGGGGGMPYDAAGGDAGELHGADGDAPPPWLVEQGEGLGAGGAPLSAAMMAGSSAAGPSTSSGGGASAGRIPPGAIVLGQATSPAEMAARGVAGLRGMPIRELDSSDAGLPPISEVVTPASSPTLRSRDRLPGAASLHGAASHHGSGSGGPPSLTDAGDLSTGARSRLRSAGPPRQMATSEGPTGLQPSTPPDGSFSDAPLPLPAGWRASDSAAAVGGGGCAAGSERLRSGTARHPAPGAPVLMRSSEGAGGVISSSPHVMRLLPHHQHQHHHRYSNPYRTQLSADGIDAGDVSDRPSGRSAGHLVSGLGSGSIAAASTARLSTGLLPSSLSYMAMRSSRDAPAATLAAMLSAGMDVRSPGGSPAETLHSISRSQVVPAVLISSGDAATHAEAAADAAAAAAAADAADGDGSVGRGPDLAAAAAAAAAAGGGGTATTPAGALLLAERSSTGTPTNALSPLVIDRSSSGFYHPWSSSQTPGPALTERSSSGRFGSGAYHAPHFTHSDRTSSGLQRSGHHTPHGLQTDRSSSSRRTLPPPASPPAPSQRSSQRSLLHGSRQAAAAAAAAQQQQGQQQGQRYLPTVYDSMPGDGHAYVSDSERGSEGRGEPASAVGGERGGCVADDGPPALQERESGAEGQSLPASFQLQQQPVLGSSPPEQRGVQPRLPGPSLQPPLPGPRGAELRQPPGVGNGVLPAPPIRMPHAAGLPLRTAVWSSSSAAAAIAALDSAVAGSGAASSDSGAAATADVARAPTFSSLAPTFSNASAGGGLDFSLYDVTISMRSSMAGSAAAGGRVSNAGEAAADSFRTFGLGHLPGGGLADPASASELLRPFALGHPERERERQSLIASRGSGGGGGGDAGAGSGAGPSRQGSGARGSGRQRWTRLGSEGSGSGPRSGAGGA